jgi:hypothetical protein
MPLITNESQNLPERYEFASEWLHAPVVLPLGNIRGTDETNSSSPELGRQ